MDMPPAVALAFFGKLDLAAAFMGRVGASEVHEWRIGTLFSGSDIAMFVAHYQCVLWRKVHGVNIEPKCVFQAELDEEKRQHLISHTPALHTFGDVAQFTSQRRLHCYRTQQDVLLPWAHTLIAGFPCKTRSKMNKSAHTHKTCVQDEVGTTGTGFASTTAVIAVQRPRLIILENAPALQEKPDPESMSDAEYIVAELQALGYWSKWFFLRCQRARVAGIQTDTWSGCCTCHSRRSRRPSPSPMKYSVLSSTTLSKALHSFVMTGTSWYPSGTSSAF